MFADGTTDETRSVQCSRMFKGCSGQGPMMESEALARAAWNTRLLACHPGLWFEEVKRIAWLLKFSNETIDSMDQQAWSEYFDAGYTPAEAWKEELDDR